MQFLFFYFKQKENIVMTNLRLQAEQKEIQINITDANVVSLQIVIKNFFHIYLLFSISSILYNVLVIVCWHKKNFYSETLMKS